MSGRLVGEVLYWLTTPAAKGISDKERLVLVTIADRVLDEETRRMRRFASDECDLRTRIAHVLGVEPESLKGIFQRLAARGLEVRVPLFYDKNGNPVYGHKGKSCGFRLPELPASVELPPRQEVLPVEEEDQEGGGPGEAGGGSGPCG